MDDVDKKILRVLEADARTSLRKIAEEVGVALGTVSNRVRRMEHLGGYQRIHCSARPGQGWLGAQRRNRFEDREGPTD